MRDWNWTVNVLPVNGQNVAGKSSLKRRDVGSDQRYAAAAPLPLRL